jgi:hypothetical protein
LKGGFDCEEFAAGAESLAGNDAFDAGLTGKWDGDAFAWLDRAKAIKEVLREVEGVLWVDSKRERGVVGGAGVSGFAVIGVRLRGVYGWLEHIWKGSKLWVFRY